MLNKILLSILLILGLSFNACANDGLFVCKSWEDVANYDAISYGVCTYTDEDRDIAGAIYGHFSMFGYGDFIRINTGLVVPPYYFDDENIIRITLEFGISTIFRDLIGDIDVELGCYYGGSANRFPYGIMIGVLL